MTSTYSIAINWLASNERVETSPVNEKKWIKYYFGFGSLLIGGVSVALRVCCGDVFEKQGALNISLTALQFLITLFMSELPLCLMMNLFLKTREKETQIERDTPLCVMNYNIKAACEEDIKQCFRNCEVSYQLNSNDNIYMAIVSSTRDETLMKYEFELSKQLKSKYHEKFHYLYRPGSCLKKCGQYHDLMMFIKNNSQSRDYTDDKYGIYKRNKEMLFDISKSSANISLLQGLKFKYILVLDSDNKITNLRLLMSIAERNPSFSIFQPYVYLTGDTSFYQYIFSTISNTISNAKEVFFERMEHCSFYGKGLINIEKYIQEIIQTDAIPVNCMSHDTFESMFLPCKYVKEVSISETYPTSHCSWSIRENRWNVGDLQVFIHHTPFHIFRKKNFKLSFQKTFIALSSFRSIIFRPLSFLFIILHALLRFSTVTYIGLLWSIFISTGISSVLLIIESKKKKRYPTRRIVLSILLSILFYIPETITGSIRFISSIKNSLMYVKWIPSSIIERKSLAEGHVRSSFNEFWLSLFIGTVISYKLGYDNPFLLVVSVSTILLPFTSSLTAASFCIPRVVFAYPDLET